MAPAEAILLRSLQKKRKKLAVHTATAVPWTSSGNGRRMPRFDGTAAADGRAPSGWKTETNRVARPCVACKRKEAGDDCRDKPSAMLRNESRRICQRCQGVSAIQAFAYNCYPLFPFLSSWSEEFRGRMRLGQRSPSLDNVSQLWHKRVTLSSS